MNSKLNLSERKSRPQSLAGAVGGLLRIFGGRASDADLLERWDEIVGHDLAKLGKLVGVRAIGGASQKPKRFNIKIKPTVPAMKMELSYRAEEFRAKINKYFGYEAVGKIVNS